MTAPAVVDVEDLIGRCEDYSKAGAPYIDHMRRALGQAAAIIRQQAEQIARLEKERLDTAREYIEEMTTARAKIAELCKTVDDDENERDQVIRNQDKHIWELEQQIAELRKDAERWRADCTSYAKASGGLVPYFEREWKSVEEQNALADAALAAKEPSAQTSAPPIPSTSPDCLP